MSSVESLLKDLNNLLEEQENSKSSKINYESNNIESNYFTFKPKKKKENSIEKFFDLESAVFKKKSSVRDIKKKLKKNLDLILKRKISLKINNF